MSQLLPLVLLFVLMYFILIRPQQQKQKAQRLSQSQISDGDQVVSSGGIYGRVTQVATDKVWVEIAPDIEVVFARTALSRLNPSIPADEFEPADNGDEEDLHAPDDLSGLDLHDTGEHKDELPAAESDKDEEDGPARS